MSWEERKELDRIYAKLINYQLEGKGEPDLLLISQDTWNEYSTELKDEIYNLDYDVLLTNHPYKLKWIKKSDIVTDYLL